MRLAGRSTVGRLAEEGLSTASLLAMAILPVLEIVLRTFFSTGIPGSSGYVQHLTLWVGFLGAIVTSKERRHLRLSAGTELLPAILRRPADALSVAVSTAVGSGLTWAAVAFVRSELKSPETLAGWAPIWVVQLVLPAAFAMITLRFVTQAEGWRARAAALLGMR